jgi:hypothetical protein
MKIDDFLIEGTSRGCDMSAADPLSLMIQELS